MEELFNKINQDYKDKLIVIADPATDLIYSFYKGKAFCNRVVEKEHPEIGFLKLMLDNRQDSQSLSKMILTFFFYLSTTTKIAVDKCRTFYHYMQELIFNLNEGEKVVSEEKQNDEEKSGDSQTS